MSNKNHTVLLVEDEPSLVKLYTAVFDKDYKLNVAKDYASAKQNMREEKSDIILLDIVIPQEKGTYLDYQQKKGFELLKDAKKDKIPVIVLTNLDSVKDRKIAKDLGAVKYVVKANILPRDLVKEVDKIVRKKS